MITLLGSIAGSLILIAIGLFGVLSALRDIAAAIREQTREERKRRD